MNIGHARRKITPQGDIYLIGYRNLPNRLAPAPGDQDDENAPAPPPSPRPPPPPARNQR